MKKWIGAAVALLFFVGLLAFLLPILGWQKQLDQESAEYEVLSSAVQLPQASEPPVVTPSEADSSVLNNLISSLDGDVLSEDIPASSAPARTSSIDLEACKAQNSDFAAWLSIPNTPVNYPVVFTYDTAYYLKHSFTGSTSSLGTLFATGDTSFSRPSRNIAIYGHNIRSKPTVMFSPRAHESLASWTTRQAPHDIVLLICPEGGFSSEEEELARQNSVIFLSMGPRILRTETAGLAAVSAINAFWEQSH